MNQPNVLWICTDQQRWDTLGCYGNEYVTTPNLDRLAAEGACFDHAFSQSPVSTPSRGAFLTGRYPRTCRARQNGAAIPDDEVLVTKMLRDAGYTCGLSGKLHIRPANTRLLGPGGVESRIDDGYSVFNWSHHSGGMGTSQNHYWDWLAEKGLEWKSEPLGDSKVVKTSMTRETSQSAYCAEMAINFIEDRSKEGQPWLFSVNPFDPHAAFDPPMEFLQPYLDRLDDIPLPNYVEGELDNKPPWQAWDHERGGYGHAPAFAWDKLSDRDHRLIRAAYWAMCDQLDVHVGLMLDALERTGQRDNTIVIYMSDHGELLGDHGMYMKGPMFYDCSVRVPLIVNCPNAIAPMRSSALVQLIDLSQTLLDAAGLEHYPGMMGKSLWPMLTGEAPPDAHHDDVYCEFYRSCEGHNGGCEMPAMATMLRSKQWKMVVAHNEGAGELYDLENDPGENNNLWGAPDYASVERELLVRMTDRLAFTADPLPPRLVAW